MTLRDCPLRFEELPAQAARVSVPVPPLGATPGLAPVPVSTDSVESTSVTRQAPLSYAMVEVSAEADRRSPSAARTPLVRSSPPPILDRPIALHSPIARTAQLVSR